MDPLVLLLLMALIGIGPIGIHEVMQKRKESKKSIDSDVPKAADTLFDGKIKIKNASIEGDVTLAGLQKQVQR
ncbi:MAG: hypothetical protein ILNGONEN_01406 [Syntrophorhabdaceae bacterium]|nr:hypothetical protein [Syntrophorhabdaceae bacterium]